MLSVFSQINRNTIKWGARFRTASMQVINANDVKVYNVSANKSLPEVCYCVSRVCTRYFNLMRVLINC